MNEFNSMIILIFFVSPTIIEVSKFLNKTMDTSIHKTMLKLAIWNLKKKKRKTIYRMHSIVNIE